MNNYRAIFQLVSLLLVSILCVSVVFAKGSELEFKAAITGINQPADGDGDITVSLFSGSSDFDVSIIITEDTKIELNGDRLVISELAVGDLVKIRAFFVADGIVAEEVDILESRLGQFRLRGVIDNVTSSDDETVIELLGIQVVINSLIPIRDRSLGTSILVESLVVGELVDVKGRISNDIFLAQRIEIGKRREGHVEFEGDIISTEGDLIIVNTRSGASLSVILDATTKIRGNLIVGAFVEVEGFLNQLLQVVAQEVKVDSNGNGDSGDDNHNSRNDDDDRNDNNRNDDDDDDDDDDRNDNGSNGNNINGAKVFREVSLQNIAGNSRIEGKVKFKYEPKNDGIKQELEVEIENAEINTAYGITVDFGNGGVDLGSIVTDGRGDAEIEFKSDPRRNDIQISSILPDNKDVRDIQHIEITLGGDIILQADF